MVIFCLAFHFISTAVLADNMGPLGKCKRPISALMNIIFRLVGTFIQNNIHLHWLFTLFCLFWDYNHKITISCEKTIHMEMCFLYRFYFVQIKLIFVCRVLYERLVFEKAAEGNSIGNGLLCDWISLLHWIWARRNLNSMVLFLFSISLHFNCSPCG